MTLPLSTPLLLQSALGGGIAPTLFMYGAIFAIFYFILLRPQQQQRKKHEASLLELKRGDQIVTAGGIVGEIVNIAGGTKDGAPVTSLTDHVTIKSGESRLVVERGRIARVIGGSAAV